MKVETENYTLKYPFDGIDAKRVINVSVRRVNAGDLMTLSDDDSNIVQTSKIIGRITGLDLKTEVSKLDAVDLFALDEIIKKQRATT